MLSFEEADDFNLFSSTPLFTHDFQQHDLPRPPPPPPAPAPVPSLPASCDQTPTRSTTQKGSQETCIYDLKDVNDLDNNDRKRKKLNHRNVERQRRQDLATLYCSLRSKLPHEWKKGRESMVNDTNVAINYIQHLKKRVTDLNEKRDTLRRLCSSTSSDRSGYGGSHVKVEACGAGVQVTIVSPKSGGLPLSKALNLLMLEGLNTVSCISIKPNQMTSIHTIQSEVSDERSIDSMNLQQKLQSSSCTIRFPNQKLSALPLR